MTQDEIIEMARDSGMELYGLGKDRARFVHHLVAFANLVATKEREACAKACQEAQEYWGWDKVVDAASLIRARGEA
jgi:hypothetical protein